MSKPTLAWLRQHTNVEDLLDDGVENNSDLKSFADHEQPSERPCDRPPVAVKTPSQTHPIEISVDEPDRPYFFGAAVGLLIIGLGLGLIFHPIDAFVFHGGSKYAYRNFLEHVTHARSEFYGSAGVLLGVALLAFSLYKPRK
jgi:hypothetical protein